MNDPVKLEPGQPVTIVIETTKLALHPVADVYDVLVRMIRGHAEELLMPPCTRDGELIGSIHVGPTPQIVNERLRDACKGILVAWKAYADYAEGAPQLLDRANNECESVLASADSLPTQLVAPTPLDQTQQVVTEEVRDDIERMMDAVRPEWSSKWHTAKDRLRKWLAGETDGQS